MERNLTMLSSPEQKKVISDVVFDRLTDYFFDKVVFINLAYSDLGGGGTTSTTNFGKLSRIIDTAEGRFMAPGKISRLRCQFYLTNPSKMEGYILSPTVYDSQTLGVITTMSIFRSYIGLKFSSGNVYAVTKEAGSEEKLKLLDFTMAMFDSTYTDTFVLEIRYNILTTDILINNINYGSFSSDIVGNYNTTETFYPFFAPARSTDGTLVNIVAENIQFIQSKN